jgi:signal transduction histidine kinase
MYLLQKAEVLYQLHEPEKANQLFYFIEKFSEQYNDIVTKYNIADKIAFIAYRQMNYQQAANSFKKSFQYYQQVTPSDYYKLAETIDNIAICYDKLQQNDSAFYYYYKALDLLNVNKDKTLPGATSSTFSKEATNRSRGVVLGNLANIYWKKNKIDTAIALSKESIAINSRGCCEERDAQLVQMLLIDIYANKKYWNNMYRELLSLRKGLDSLPNAEPELNYHRQMSTYYNAIKEPAKAFPYLLKYSIMKDSATMMEKKDAKNNVVKDLQLNNQEVDISLLKKDNQLSKLYLWITVGLIIVALNIIAFFVYNYKKTKQNNTVLTLLNEQIYDQKTELEKANKDKDRIMNMVIHDLRNPIGGIAAVSKRVLEDEEIPKDSQILIQLINKASVNSLTLINELLQSNESVTESLKIAATDINELVKQSVFLLNFKAKEKKQQIETKLLTDPLIISIDAYKIARVIENLIGNAVKFSPPQTVITVSIQKNKSDVVVAVKDQGIGVPSSQKEKVFSMFTTAKRIGTEGEKSFGLGLSICKQIIEQHGGKIAVESEESNGSCFYFLLPLDNV